MKISIVSAVYQAEEILPSLVERVSAVLKPLGHEFEFILVDDRSRDGSWSQIQKLAGQFPNVKGIRLSRNFGQHKTISAGLDHADGDFTLLVDCDLQDSVESIPQLIDEALKGNHIVFARKETRQYSFLRNLASRIYFGIYNFLTEGEKIDSRVGTFSVLSRKAVLAFRRFKDVHRHYVLVVNILGFKTSYVSVPHFQRVQGRSSYSLGKLITHALDGITSQSTKLLKYISVIGFFVFVAGVCFGIYLIFNYFYYGTVPSGYTSIAVLVVFSLAINLIFLGVSSLYLGKIFEQVKGRPLYLVDEQIGFTGDRHE